MPWRTDARCSTRCAGVVPKRRLLRSPVARVSAPGRCPCRPDGQRAFWRRSRYGRGRQIGDRAVISVGASAGAHAFEARKRGGDLSLGGPPPKPGSNGLSVAPAELPRRPCCPFLEREARPVAAGGELTTAWEGVAALLAFEGSVRYSFPVLIVCSERSRRCRRPCAAGRPLRRVANRDSTSRHVPRASAALPALLRSAEMDL